MLVQFDRLCESLDDTLGEVVLVFFPGAPDSLEHLKTLQADRVNTVRSLRNHMPRMSRRQRLAFRASRESWPEYRDDGMVKTVHEHILAHDSPYWKDIALDD